MSIITSKFVGNLEKAALISSIPFFLEFILKYRGKFNVKSYGKEVDGKIASHHKKIYSLVHLFTNTPRFTEKQIVWFFIFIQLGVSSLIWVL